MRELAQPIMLVGAGKMGSALLNGWLASNGKADANNNFVVIEPHPSSELESLVANDAVTLLREPAEASVEPAVMVLAVKPQMLEQVLRQVKGCATPETVILSIIAGSKIATFEETFGSSSKIVRAMPNTPASIGRGITVCCANASAKAPEQQICEQLLSAVGDVAWVDTESLLDPVTAVSGSGPAYVFLMIEAMTEAGISAGLPPELAQRLVRATVSGAGELARQSQESAATLRKNVTSPGGTTEAALKVLMAPDGLERLMKQAVEAATKRSIELGN